VAPEKASAPTAAVPSAAPAVPMPEATAAAGDGSEDTQLVAAPVSNTFQLPFPGLMDRAQGPVQNLESAIVPKVQCGLCGSPCELSKVRIMSKRAGTFKCGHCCSTVTKLYRTGNSNTPSFEGFSKEQQNEFWKMANNCHTADQLRTVCTQFQITKTAERTKSYFNGGEFQPLGVWAARGYSIDDIRSKTSPEDVRTDPVLGLVYRVVIMSAGEGGSSTTSIAASISGGSKRDRDESSSDKLERLASEVKKVKKSQRDEVADKKKCAAISAQCLKSIQQCESMVHTSRAHVSDSVQSSFETLKADFEKFSRDGASTKDRLILNAYIKGMDREPTYMCTLSYMHFKCWRRQLVIC